MAKRFLNTNEFTLDELKRKNCQRKYMYAKYDKKYKNKKKYDL